MISMSSSTLVTNLGAAEPSHFGYHTIIAMIHQVILAQAAVSQGGYHISQNVKIGCIVYHFFIIGGSGSGSVLVQEVLKPFPVVIMAALSLSRFHQVQLCMIVIGSLWLDWWFPHITNGRFHLLPNDASPKDP